MDSILIIITSVISVISTFIFANKLKLGNIKASALLSLLVGILFYLINIQQQNSLFIIIPVVFFGASFAGMSSVKVLQNSYQLIVAGLVFGLIFILTQNHFTGFGGGLGIKACISVLICVGLFKIINSLKYFLHKHVI